MTRPSLDQLKMQACGSLQVGARAKKRPSTAKQAQRALDQAEAVTPSSKVVRRPATDLEQRRANALYQHVTFLPASFDKRFCREMAGVTEITEKQAALLEVMAWRHRRQLKGVADDVIPAEKPPSPFQHAQGGK